MVVLKEVYLFVTFVTLATLLSKLSARDFRFVMSVWLGAVVLHGLIILLEFLQPSVFRYIAGLAGQSMSYEHFRPSGLFFSPKAGNANKAAVFQLLGFVPLGLARPSRRVATVLGIVLLSSILATGSMGTTLSFIAGFVAAVVAIAVLGNHVVLVTKLVMRSMIAVVLLGGLLFVVIGNNQDYQEHFESIIFGRAQKSSEGRFTLWERGLETLQESNTLLWGLGPENFRDVDVLEKQLHNDVLAFSVERGLLGVLGLVLLAAFAMARAVRLFKLGCKYPQHVGLTTVVVLATFVSVLVVSLTHQVFHCREIWLVLASQEALLVHYGRAPAIAMPRIGLVQSHECWGKS